MRDTIIFLFIFSLFIGAYRFFNHSDNNVPQINAIPKITKKIKEGVINEHTQLARKQRIKNGSSEKRDPRPSSENESLPSLYSQQPKQRIEETDLTEPEVKPVIKNGVSLQAWAESQKNQLPETKPVNDTTSGLRVFVGCMEVKRPNIQALDSRECSKLIAKNRNSQN